MQMQLDAADEDEDLDERQGLGSDRRRRGGIVDQSQSDEDGEQLDPSHLHDEEGVEDMEDGQFNDFEEEADQDFSDEDEQAALQMEDVSINLEEGLPSDDMQQHVDMLQMQQNMR